VQLADEEFAAHVESAASFSEKWFKHLNVFQNQHRNHEIRRSICEWPTGANIMLNETYARIIDALSGPP
jgi:hypothetical protein